jgi:hypothetical protein
MGTNLHEPADTRSMGIVHSDPASPSRHRPIRTGNVADSSPRTCSG